MSTHKASSELMNKVLDVLSGQSAMGITELSRVTGKSPSAISAAIAELNRLGCISKGVEHFRRKDGEVTYHKVYIYEQDLPEGYKTPKRMQHRRLIERRGL